MSDSIALRTIRPSVLYFGTPVLLIATRNADGSANLTPMSSAWALADRVVLGLAGGGQGLANLEREGECTLNVAGPDAWRAVEALAPTTGCDPVPSWKAGYRYAADKFALAGLTPRPSEIVAPPRVAECPLQMEARVVEIRRRALPAWREAAGGFAIVETEVLRVHAHADMTLAGSDHVDPQRFRPLLYVFRHYVGGGPSLGRTFKAEV
ncbi:flavin reductase family protein [Oleiagrimonas citrea]|uniref:Flavin reductase family protein n=1 Tax=Oleiagrimonas citrea TaxID=1665687 RepID=A0A846ZLC9_9GAMM|nr:flavin reductase family protein [Oleiagrimonas citrea]NKZ38632.1 flavin reductase family protein [Oleiagrimonas citrea]